MDFYFEIALQRAEDVKSLQWLQDMARIEYPEYPGKANGWTMHSPRLTMQHVSQGRKRCGVNARSVVWLVSDESRHLHIANQFVGVYVHATWSRQLSFFLPLVFQSTSFRSSLLTWRSFESVWHMHVQVSGTGSLFPTYVSFWLRMLRASCIYGCARVRRKWGSCIHMSRRLLIYLALARIPADVGLHEF